jgi:ABC-2 type transport system ATP-binding protein
MSPCTAEDLPRRDIVFGMNVIEVSGLRYSYGSFTAVDGVDFAVAQGEVFALLGTNGAGKTTTLEIIEGFRRPAAGTVRVLGRDPFSARTSLTPMVGVMLQESGFVGEMTVAETIGLWGRISGRTDDPAAVLARLDLAHRAGVAVEQLSGGERRRLDVALAIWGRPRLVVLDEPSTGRPRRSRTGWRSCTLAGSGWPARSRPCWRPARRGSRRSCPRILRRCQGFPAPCPSRMER